MVYLLVHFVPVFRIHGTPSKGSHCFHDIFIEVNRTFHQSHDILQYLYALFQIVVDIGSFCLDALLKL